MNLEFVRRACGALTRHASLLGEMRAVGLIARGVAPKLAADGRSRAAQRAGYGPHALHALDVVQGNKWDASVSSDTQSSDFSFSLGGRAFFVVGSHPNASRLSRPELEAQADHRKAACELTARRTLFRRFLPAGESRFCQRTDRGSHGKKRQARYQASPDLLDLFFEFVRRLIELLDCFVRGNLSASH